MFVLEREGESPSSIPSGIARSLPVQTGSAVAAAAAAVAESERYSKGDGPPKHTYMQ